MEKKERVLKIGLTAATLVFILLIFYTNLFHYNYRMNADIGAEALLGELIWQSKEILPDTWYPSTEVRIVSTPDVAALFYGMTGSMTLAMGLGCCFMTALIVMGISFFCKKAQVWGGRLSVNGIYELGSARGLYFSGTGVCVCRLLCDTDCGFIFYIGNLCRNASYGESEISMASGRAFGGTVAGISRNERNPCYIRAFIWDRGDKEDLPAL